MPPRDHHESLRQGGPANGINRDAQPTGRRHLLREATALTALLREDRLRPQGLEQCLVRRIVVIKA